MPPKALRPPAVGYGLLGFSYDGQLTMIFAERYPQLIDLLVLASTTAYPDIEGYLATNEECLRRAPESAAIWADGSIDADEKWRRDAMAGAPMNLWDLGLLGQWRAVLAKVRFSGAWVPGFEAGVVGFAAAGRPGTGTAGPGPADADLARRPAVGLPGTGCPQAARRATPQRALLRAIAAGALLDLYVMLLATFGVLRSHSADPAFVLILILAVAGMLSMLGVAAANLWARSRPAATTGASTVSLIVRRP